MEQETGIVISVQRGSALVRLKRKTGCDGCKACLAGKEAGYMHASVRDPIGVTVGDWVNIDFHKASAAASGFILYILPLIMLAAGYFVGEALARWLGLPSADETMGISVGLAFFALTFLGIFLQQKIMKKKPLVMAIQESGKPRDNEPLRSPQWDSKDKSCCL